MIFTEKKSALVRLSDSIKVELNCCAITSRQILDLFAPYEAAFREAQAIARRAQAEDAELVDVERELKQILKAVPESVAWEGAALQGQLHSQALSSILLCCFCLESYINSLAYFLFEERDFLGLIKDGHKISAELLIEAIERMSTREKWKTVGRLRGAAGFDPSQSPFQDFQVLFKFRDDHVHDKVVEYSDDRPHKRYNGKLPDPAFGFLTLSHALYAARTFWSMVAEIHNLISVSQQSFHRHYNLAPWFNDEHRQDLEQVAAEYERKISSNVAA